MDSFQEMQVFVAVVDERGFASAARRLNLSAPSVTRAVSALESRLGATLLTRTTRSVYVTEAGRRFAEDCRRILAELQEAEESASGTQAAPRGQLTVTAPVLFGEMFVTPLLVEFLKRHAAIQVKALLVDRVVNMADEGIDVAIRIGNLPDSGLNTVRVGEVRRVICASPAFLAAHARPTHPEQLLTMPVVASSSSGLVSEWQFAEGDRPIRINVEPRLLVSANQAAIQAAVLGYGFARVLSYQIANRVANGELEIVLQNFELPPLPIHLVYQATRKMSAKLAAFIDFCAARFLADPALQRLDDESAD